MFYRCFYFHLLTGEEFSTDDEVSVTSRGWVGVSTEKMDGLADQFDAVVGKRTYFPSIMSKKGAFTVGIGDEYRDQSGRVVSCNVFGSGGGSYLNYKLIVFPPCFSSMLSVPSC